MYQSAIQNISRILVASPRIVREFFDQFGINVLGDADSKTRKKLIPSRKKLREREKLGTTLDRMHSAIFESVINKITALS